MTHQLGYSVNTIRKYLNAGCEQLKTDTSKVSTFDLSNRKFIIKSVSDNQDEILFNILRLHIHRETFDCDLTYGKGVFYLHLAQPPMKIDKYPCSKGVAPLEKAKSIRDSSLAFRHN